MTIKDIIIRVLKKSYRFLFQKKFLNPKCEIDRQKANDAIYNLLSKDAPCMISRFGTTEMNAINNYLCVTNDKKYTTKLWEYITDHTHTPWWTTSHFEVMSVYSGIFPPSVDTTVRFSERYLKDIPEIDLLGAFQYHEKFMPLREDIIKIQLETMYPFFVENPWTRILKGKKVLVVHPFDQSIREQYEKRKDLFDDQNILPDFELITFQAVQSVGGAKVPFKDWFEALKYMEDKISNIDFDICILGCGAYGMPLAAHIKRIGKKAVHIGGGTQLLFGIKGKRWEEQYNTDFNNEWKYRPNETINLNYKDLFNENWSYPGDNEKPKGAENVEGACYW